MHHADYFLFKSPCLDWKLKWIRERKIDEQKIIWLVNNDHFSCEQLILPNNLY